MIDQAIEHLRDLIVRGALEPGSKLPPEPELAAILGCSRSTVREESLLELWEIRMLLELPATAKAAKKISDGRLVELAEILEQMRRSADDDSVLVRHDGWFHELVAQAAGNQALALLLGSTSSGTMMLGEKAAQLTSAWLGDESCGSDVAPMQGEFTGCPELPASWAAMQCDAIGADLADRQRLPHP